MWFNILKPLLLTLVLSSSVSLLIAGDLYSFLKYFFVVTVLQIILYNAYKTVVSLFAEKIKNERIKEFSKQGLEVTCPCYLSKKMFVPIELGADNSFNCLECKKDVSVEVKASTFMKTDMINLDQTESDLIKAYKEIQEKE